MTTYAFIQADRNVRILVESKEPSKVTPEAGPDEMINQFKVESEELPRLEP